MHRLKRKILKNVSIHSLNMKKLLLIEYFALFNTSVHFDFCEITYTINIYIFVYTIYASIISDIFRQKVFKGDVAS